MVLTPNGPPTKKKEQFAHLRARMGSAPLLQLGDNLSDHEPDRYSKDTQYDGRAANAEKDKSRWGDDWIAFPNSVYGAWRQSLRWKDGTGSEHIVADENPPMPFQAAPVREAVATADSLKVKILNRWNGQAPQQRGEEGPVTKVNARPLRAEIELRCRLYWPISEIQPC